MTLCICCGERTGAASTGETSAVQLTPAAAAESKASMMQHKSVARVRRARSRRASCGGCSPRRRRLRPRSLRNTHTHSYKMGTGASALENLPDQVDKDTAKLLLSEKFDEAAFDVYAKDGSMSKEDFVKLVKGGKGVGSGKGGGRNRQKRRRYRQKQRRKRRS